MSIGPRLAVETGTACRDQDKADRFLELVMGSRNRNRPLWTPRSAISLGRPDQQPGLMLQQVLSVLQEAHPDSAVVGLRGYQFCRKDKHDGGSLGPLPANFHVERFGAWVVRKMEVAKELEVDLGSISLDSDGIGTALVEGKEAWVFDIGNEKLDRDEHPVYAAVQANRPEGGRLTFGLLREGLNGSVSPTQLAAAQVLGGYF